MSVVKCYNTASGHVEDMTVPLPTEKAARLLECFAANDTQTDHTYFLTTVED